MPFEPNTLFPGLLSESAARVAQDMANHPGNRPAAALIREMGWNAVLIPEAQGGAGGDLQDLAAIIEGIATHAVNLPIVTRCGVIPAILNALPEQPSAHTLQTGIADGAIIVEVGGPLHSGDPTPPLSASKDNDGWQLSGTTSGIELTDDCTHVLLTGRDAADNNKAMLICLAIAQLTCSSTVYRTMDDRQITVFELDKFHVSDADTLATGTAAAQSIHAGWRIAAAATATDSVCSMGSALSRTISYLIERKQFGHALADFQALRHDVARLYVVYELCRSLLQATLRTLEPVPANDDTAALDLLGLYIGNEAIRFAEAIIQLHGGMGMTREMPAAQLATRLLANALRYGDPLTYEQKIHNLRSGGYTSFSHGVNTQGSRGD